MLQPAAVLPEVNYGWRAHLQIKYVEGLFKLLFQENQRQKTRRTTNMLTMTDTARDKFKELMKEHTGKFLRVVFEGFG